MAKGSKRRAPQPTRKVDSRNATADTIVFALVATVVSAAFFTATNDWAAGAGYTSMSVGPFALAAGVIIAARGLRWGQKWRPLLVLLTSFGVLMLLGTPLWFGVYRLGDLSTAPAYLAIETVVPFLLYAAFTFLPWAIPAGVLVVTVGRDPRKLWSSGGRG